MNRLKPVHIALLATLFILATTGFMLWLLTDISLNTILLLSIGIAAFTGLVIFYTLNISLKHISESKQNIASSANPETELKKLKETEAFRKEFIGNLAHELKTPVFSVQGYILTLLEGGLEDETINRKFLKKASKGMERITAVIEDMDVITRIESGILELDITNFDLLVLLKNVFFELEEKAETKNIELKIDSSKAKVFVMADRSRLTQVLYNLIINSIYYGNDNGTTIVEVIDNKDNVLVQIKDNGPGIEKEHLNRLFERFYRVEKSRTRNKGGSGIGLAIVKHIIEAHNQTISVASEIEKGTVFEFSLDK